MLCNNRWWYQSVQQIRESRMQRSRGNILNRASTERKISQVRMRRRRRRRGGCHYLGGYWALWENGHANEGQIHRAQLHCKWADFVRLGSNESLKCCLLIKGGKSEKNMTKNSKARRSSHLWWHTHTAVVIARKRLALLLVSLWRLVGELWDTPWH